MKITIVIIHSLSIILLMPFMAEAQVRSSTNYNITEEVVATGGHAATSANYTNVSTSGQSGTVGVHNSINYENQSGFWHTVLLELPIPTLSSIGLILLMLGMGFILLRKKIEGERTHL